MVGRRLAAAFAALLLHSPAFAGAQRGATPCPTLRPPPAISLPVVLKPPTGADLIARAAALPGGLSRAGAAVQEARTLPQALVSLKALGVVAEGEFDRAEGQDRDDFRDALLRLWFDAAPATPRRHDLDRSWAVPATTVRAGGVTYKIHGIVHSPTLDLPPANAGAVRRLVSEIEKNGGELISEHLLPAVYGYNYGWEADDRFSAVLGRPEPVPAAKARAARAVWTALAAAAALVPAAFVIHDPSYWPAWAALGAGGGFAYLARTAFLPLRWAAFLSRELPARSADAAHHLKRWAAAVFLGRMDPDALRRVTLPMPLSEYWDTKFTFRAQALAKLAAQRAAEAGLQTVHILTGYGHAAELAGLLDRER